jgi:cytochrome c biogenesis protein CcmG/thiol:disulfide interchange protein DsbE
MAAACMALLLSGTLAGCADNTRSTALDAVEVTPDLTGADPRLVKLVGQSDEILDGGKPAYQARLRSLKGLPVVVNKWASWCVPCRGEAPILQRTARDLGNRVAFLGVNVNDSADASYRFRSEFPMPFPSYDDPDAKIAALLPPGGKQPVTGIFDAEGRLAHLEIGAYETAKELRGDIERYAGPIGPPPGS